MQDNEWHHVAVTWRQSDGSIRLFFDGVEKTPFWRSDQGKVSDRSPQSGGVQPTISPGTKRAGGGSLVLGHKQDCVGGCFSPSQAFAGKLSQVRPNPPFSPALRPTCDNNNNPAPTFEERS